jgi:hypothetical protein
MNAAPGFLRREIRGGMMGWVVEEESILQPVISIPR